MHGPGFDTLPGCRIDACQPFCHGDGDCCVEDGDGARGAAADG